MSRKHYSSERNIAEILAEIQSRSDVEVEDSPDSGSSVDCSDEEEEEEFGLNVPVYNDEEEDGPGPSSRCGEESPLIFSFYSDNVGDDEGYVLPQCIAGKKRPRSPSASSSSSLSPEPQRGRRGRSRGRGCGPQTRKPLRADGDWEEAWRTKEDPDIVPDVPKFEPKHPPGPRIDPTVNWSPLSLFQLFFSSSVLHTLIKNTNENAAKRLAGGKLYKWLPLTVDTFLVFLSVIIFSGLVHTHERADMWKTKWPYNFPFPRSLISRARFEAIFWSLHMSDLAEDEENERKRGTPAYDRLFKIKPLYNDIVEACRSLYQPDQNITIAERMVASKARTGDKLFVLADSKTGYTSNFFVHQGKGKKSRVHQEEDELSVSAVMNLMDFELLGKGYRLYVDNFSTSALLFQKLAENHTVACGTIRPNRQGFPKNVKNDLPLEPQRGDMRWMRKNNLLFVRWMDTKVVNMCSSFHQAYSGATALRRVKGDDGQWRRSAVDIPDACKDYNVNMGGVDRANALIQYYTVLKKTMRWYKAFFYHFIDIAVVNSYILYRCVTKSQPLLTHKQFREALIREMVEQAKALVVESAPRPSLTSTCMPLYRGDTASERRKCVLCSAIEKEKAKKIPGYKVMNMKTPIYCSKCDVSLCLVPGRNCFVEYHGFPGK